MVEVADDHALAMYLQMLYDEEDKASNQQEELPKPSKNLSLIDDFWELTDPNPDIHALFIQFDREFFWNKLQSVSINWSPRMTLCAGLCRYEGRGGLCSISLSQPLLKLRPRKDLVETLLHEMIHAFLFVTHNNKDHNDHGPEFHKHMYRINRNAGTKITVYHNFHAEVDSYRQHWWRCTGPCRNQRPFFGFVKRALNRAPGPNDTWWAEHKAKCHGTFEKIREPENYKPRKAVSSLNNTLQKKAASPKTDIRKHLSELNGQGGSLQQGPPRQLLKRPSSISSISTAPLKIPRNSPGSGIKKGLNSRIPQPGPSAAIHTLDSFLSGSPSSSPSPFVPFSGKGNVLGSSDRKIIKLGKRSVAAAKKNDSPVNRRIDQMFTKASPPNTSSRISTAIEILDLATESHCQARATVACPACGSDIFTDTINDHLDTCLS